MASVGVKRAVQAGDVVRVELPWSEVNMHMRIAGLTMSIEVLDDGAQLLNDDGSKFSFPITHGEAGIYGHGDDMYTYTVG